MAAPSFAPPAPPIIAPPERSLIQRMDALERANEIRTKRAQLKRNLKADRRTVVAVDGPRRISVAGGVAGVLELLLMDAPPDWLETVKVFDLMLATPKYGRVKVNKVFVQARISPSKSLGGLTTRQRNELASRIH